MYNSDYEIRLATLLALGYSGNTNFDSIYSIDLEILKLTQEGGGGGEGLNYDQIKAALVASGVTEILFNDGTSSVTLDYNKVMQISQGGGGNVTVDTIAELSGITNPTDGQFAFIQQHQATANTLLLEIDEKNNGWLEMYLNYPSLDDQITMYINSKGHQIYTYGRWYDSDNTDITDWLNVDEHLSDLPLYAKHNGTTVALISSENGAEYESEQELKNTFLIFPYDGELPTVSFSDQSNIIASSLTSGSTTVLVKAVGKYRYYADISMWQPYEIFFDNLEASDIQTILNAYHTYNKPLFMWRKAWQYGDSVRRFDAAKTDYNFLMFSTTLAQDPSAQYQFIQFNANYSTENNKWEVGNAEHKSVVRGDQANRATSEAIRQPNVNDSGRYTFGDGCLYAVALNNPVSGTVYSTDISFDSTVTAEDWVSNVFRFNNVWSGQEAWIHIRENGFVKVGIGKQLIFKYLPSASAATINDGWYVLDYHWQDDANNYNGGYAAAAVRIYDVDGSTFRVQLFISLQQDGYQDMYSIYKPSRYTWTETSGQTVDFGGPFIYITTRNEYGNDNVNGRTLVKL